MRERSLFAGQDPPEIPAIDPSNARFVRVAPELGIERGSPRAERSRVALSAQADGSLTYLDPGLSLAVGQRVRVPLGKSDASTHGVVVAAGGQELLEGLPPEKLKAVLGVTDGGLPPKLVELARWMASYYVCPLGMVLSTMTPAAVKQSTGRRIETRFSLAPPTEGAPKLTKPAAACLERLRLLPADAFPLSKAALREALEGRLRGCKELLAKGVLLQTRVSAVHARSTLPPIDTTLDRTSGVAISPTGAQSAAIEGIGAALGAFSAHLLFGVTGSGKTEVYLRLIDRVLARGQTAIVLVPEISLTPQAAARFRARFEQRPDAPTGVAVLHSGLSAALRHREWSRACGGEVGLVVGARSAVFSPLANVGLIVVDEEHDSSYKQDQLPRYHARDVAIRRAQLENCPVVLGSATPSLESWHNTRGRAGAPGKFRLWELPRRVGEGRLPRVEVVDLVEERRVRARAGGGSYSSTMGPRLEDALERTLREGGQAILLLNRRGFANFVGCSSRTCGWMLTCDDCDAAMVFHKTKKTDRGGWVACHHCLARKLRPARCPVCGSAVVSLGLGTQRVEEELATRFGELGIRAGETLVRVDSDTMHSARDYFDVLTRFGRGEIRVMVGTQMIAKGLDFPNVRLVGVVMADTALNVPDFRAAERTFQLVSQVAGRAGRGEHAGIVVVQALQPEAPAIVHAARHDYRGFAEPELASRAKSGLPPSTRMARIVARDKNEDKAWSAAEAIARALKHAGGRPAESGPAAANHAPAHEIRVLGPASCPIARIAQHYRVAVDVIAPSAVALNRVLSEVRAAGVLKSDAHTAVDVDPVALM